MDSTASILFGKTRRAVLSLLFEQPDRRFFLRELSRLTGISPGALQHELGRLGRAEIIERAQDGNRVTYRANTTHPVFSELQSIVHKTCGIPSLLKVALAPFAEKITFAAVYGSIAKGTDHARSDVDLLIVGSLGLDQATQTLAPVEEQIGREIGLRVFSSEEFRRRRKRKDAFLHRVMSGPLTTILGDPPSA
jgi:predicted nucleotidyltransferase